MYRCTGKGDVLLLDRLQEGDPFHMLRTARQRVGDGAILYVNNIIERPVPVRPRTRRVCRQHLMRWLDRTGWKCIRAKEYTVRGEHRVFAIAEKDDGRES